MTTSFLQLDRVLGLEIRQLRHTQWIWAQDLEREKHQQSGQNLVLSERTICV